MTAGVSQRDALQAGDAGVLMRVGPLTGVAGNERPVIEKSPLTALLVLPRAGYRGKQGDNTEALGW